MVITGLKGQLALGKQTEASPSLPVGNSGLSCRVHAWETYFGSSLRVQLLLEVGQGCSQCLLQLGSLKGRRPHSEGGSDQDTSVVTISRWFSSLAAH